MVFDFLRFALVAPLFIGKAYCSHFTDCSSLSDNECFANQEDCQFVQTDLCIPASLPPLQVVFVIDTTLADESAYNSLSQIYDFFDEILESITSYVCLFWMHAQYT